MLAAGAVMVAAALGSSAPLDSAPLPGCRSSNDIVNLLTKVKHEWGAVLRSDLGELSGSDLEPVARQDGSNEITALARKGRVINNQLECGETYHFAVGRVRGVKERLDKIRLLHAERTREKAVEAAELFAEVVAPPAGARRSGYAVVEEPRDLERIVDAAWDEGTETQLLIISIGEGASTWTVELHWEHLEFGE